MTLGAFGYVARRAPDPDNVVLFGALLLPMLIPGLIMLFSRDAKRARRGTRRGPS